MQHITGATARAIAASIEQAVAGGLVASGETLPAIRRLAADLRVSPVTVAAAYRRLRARGLVVGDGRRGTRVRAVSGPPAGPTPRASPLGDLATGTPDPQLLPPVLPVLRTLEYSPPLYSGPALFRPLEMFARGEFAADGVPADSLFAASGALDAVQRLLEDHLRPGDRVGLEDPCLPGLVELIEAYGYIAEPMEVDQEGPLPDSFDRALRRAGAIVVTARAQNPTGGAVTAPRAAALKRLLRSRRDVLLVESDPCGPVSGAALTTLCDGSHRQWAAVRSTSKFLGPDLRLALVAGDDLTVARAQRRQAIGARWVSHLLQQVAFALWSDPSSARRLARAADVYAQRRTALLSELAARGIHAQAASGFNVWLPVRAETATVQELAARGWAVAPGERFRLRSGAGVRVTTAALAPADAQRFAADFEAAARAGSGAVA
jgi:DNA-binding transcriptional MocR family regulator